MYERTITVTENGKVIREVTVIDVNWLSCVGVALFVIIPFAVGYFL